MADYTKTLGWLRWSSKKIEGVNYKGAIILFERVSTSGFVRLDMGPGYIFYAENWVLLGSQSILPYTLRKVRGTP